MKGKKREQVEQEVEQEHPKTATVIQGYYNNDKYPKMIDVEFDGNILINYTRTEVK